MPKPPADIDVDTTADARKKFETLSELLESPFYNSGTKIMPISYNVEPACPQCGTTDVERLALREPVELSEDLPLRCRDCKTEFSAEYSKRCLPHY